MINIDDLTLGQIKEVQRLAGCVSVTPPTSAAHPYPVGENVFIRTVTMYYTGKLVEVFEKELVLTDAAWIADTGRFHEALTTGKLNEVEPFPDGQRVVVPRDGSEVSPLAARIAA